MDSGPSSVVAADYLECKVRFCYFQPPTIRQLHLIYWETVSDLFLVMSVDSVKTLQTRKVAPAEKQQKTFLQCHYVKVDKLKF